MAMEDRYPQPSWCLKQGSTLQQKSCPTFAAKTWLISSFLRGLNLLTAYRKPVRGRYPERRSRKEGCPGTDSKSLAFLVISSPHSSGRGNLVVGFQSRLSRTAQTS